MDARCAPLGGPPPGAAKTAELRNERHCTPAASYQLQVLETAALDEVSYSWRPGMADSDALRLSGMADFDAVRKRTPIKCMEVPDESQDTDAGSRKRLFKPSIHRGLGLAFAFGGLASVFKVLVPALPPDFLERWRKLEQEQGPGLNAVTESQPETVIYDCHGEVIATIVAGGYSGRRHPLKDAGLDEPLRPADIPSAMWQAVVASEDRRFFEHHGVDPKGISRAVLSLAASGGGSTITQQLVKNLFLTNERKWTRKIVEIILAVLLEKRLSKWEILHLYLEKIYWGHGLYGLKAASAFYFGKHPSLLSLGECAMLAGIIPAPELLSPFREPSRGKKAQARTLRRMVEVGYLDSETAAAVVIEPLRLAVELQEGTSGPWRAPYFVSEVLYQLMETYGRDKVVRGGLQVYTTLDLSMQETAENAVRDAVAEYDRERMILADRGIEKTHEKIENLEKTREEQIDKAVAAAVKRAQNDARKRYTKKELRKVGVSIMGLAAEKSKAAAIARLDWMERSLKTLHDAYQEESAKAPEARMEAAVVAIDPLDGGVKVLVGGRDYYESSFNRCTQAFRPPGSTFKPVVYLAALAEGIDVKHVLMDEPYTVGGFTPENYDRKFRGKVTVEESLLNSLNVPTVKLCAEIGVDKVCNMGRILGIDTYLPYELSLSLGGCEVTPMQLATVYCTIASGGVYRKPFYISRVVDSYGQILQEQPPPSQEVVVDEHAVSELRKVLQATVERGTGRAARLRRPCAGKTGTSDGHRDAWFAGFTPELSCVVWLGYDDNAPLGGMHPATGSSHAAPLWKHFMSVAHEGLPVGRFHDVGMDRYGGKAPRQFERKSRRPPRHSVRSMGLDTFTGFTNERSTHWRRIWDWEKASIAWEEREKMQAWTIARSHHGEMQWLRGPWEIYVLRPTIGLYSNLRRLTRNLCSSTNAISAN